MYLMYSPDQSAFYSLVLELKNPIILPTHHDCVTHKSCYIISCNVFAPVGTRIESYFQERKYFSGSPHV